MAARFYRQLNYAAARRPLIASRYPLKEMDGSFSGETAAFYPKAAKLNCAVALAPSGKRKAGRGQQRSALTTWAFCLTKLDTPAHRPSLFGRPLHLSPTSSFDEYIRAQSHLSHLHVRLSLRRDGPARACKVHQRVS